MELSLMTSYALCSITSHTYVSMKQREGGREGGREAGNIKRKGEPMMQNIGGQMNSKMCINSHFLSLPVQLSGRSCVSSKPYTQIVNRDMSQCV